MESLPSQEKVILVGHSFGGISISLAMERFPHKISVAVFVAAFVTCEKLIYTNVIPKESVKDAYKWGHRRIVFHGYKDLTLGLSLVRPHPIFNDKKLLLKETRVTKQRIGRVPKVFIITKEDNLLTEDFQMWMIESTSHVLRTKKSSPLTF